MSNKKRFGISIGSKLAERLDKFCMKLGINRSKVVEQAVSRFLDDVEHYLKSHYCTSLLIVSCSGEAVGLRELIEKHSDRVVLDVHNHDESHCREVFIIESDSEKILKLYRHVVDLKRCKVLLVSLHND